MIYRRAKGAGVNALACCHTFRATGITAYLENGGTIEKAQPIVGPIWLAGVQVTESLYW